MGFIATDKDHLVFMGDYFKLLHKSMFMLDHAADPLRVQFMTKEERTKFEILQESKRIYAEEKKKKQDIVDKAK